MGIYRRRSGAVPGRGKSVRAIPEAFAQPCLPQNQPTVGQGRKAPCAHLLMAGSFFSRKPHSGLIYPDSSQGTVVCRMKPNLREASRVLHTGLVPDHFCHHPSDPALPQSLPPWGLCTGQSLPLSLYQCASKFSRLSKPCLPQMYVSDSPQFRINLFLHEFPTV